ncbi:MAG: sodium/solute symporter [Pseudomonadota bacterium]
MNGLDTFVVAIYLIGLLLLGYALRQQRSEKDYYLAGRTISWVPLTLSTMATQLSAISFISAPAFVGLREGGGLKWLSYELALPLAMILLIFLVTPALYRAGAVSIYAFLENRFDLRTRLLVSLSFQLVRSFSTGIMVYAMALILDAVLGISHWQAILWVGVITLLYASAGGMRAVVYGDALQMILIFIGLLLVGACALASAGSLGTALAGIASERMVAINFSSLGLEGDGFWPMLIGGVVLYASYYGCDQSEAQRILSARSLRDAQKLLLANGLLRFPLVLLYCVVGLLVGYIAQKDPVLLARIPADKPDYLMPLFVIEYLPHGAIGLLLVAIMSAAMSSLSSAVNSLSATTLSDLNSIGIKPKHPSAQLTWARATSLFWGVLILFTSLFAGAIAPTVIEAINKVGSALFGPILGVFLLAITSQRVSSLGASSGLLAGAILNVGLWKFHPQLFWMWWNVTGLLSCLFVAYTVTFLFKTQMQANGTEAQVATSSPAQRPPAMFAILLLIAFTIILLTSLSAESWASAGLDLR